MTIIGVTGTQRGGTESQLLVLRQFLLPVGTELHHGDCIGVDAEAHELMADIKASSPLPAGHRIVIQPPDNPDKRAFCQGYDEIWPEMPYLIRNQAIASQSDLLIAVPVTDEEQLRSGTWATVRHAHQIGKLVLVILRDGTIWPYSFVSSPHKPLDSITNWEPSLTDLRTAIVSHIHAEHGSDYPAGHDFVLVSTADVIRQHEDRFPACSWKQQ